MSDSLNDHTNEQERMKRADVAAPWGSETMSEEQQAHRLAGQSAPAPMPAGSSPPASTPPASMPDRASEMGRQAGEAAEDAKQRISDAAGEAADRASEAEEMGRERAAEGAERTASFLRDRSDGGAMGAAEERAAQGMERTAQYLRQHDSSAMMEDIERYVKEHPMQGIAGAVAAGFVVGRILR